MKSYTIRMNIDIVPSDESPYETPTIHQDGSVQMTLAESDAYNIDRCEHALLQTTYPALRNALSAHLSALSKKKPVNR
jgi:hypothetical protein